jgi:hypothetical protein
VCTNCPADTRFPLVASALSDTLKAMSKASTQPVPKDLRQQLIQRIQSAPESDVVLLHDIWLSAAKDRLWREIQQNAITEQEAGKLDQVPDLVRRYRARQPST